MILGALGIFISLVVLIVLAYRGTPVIVAAPIAAALCVLLAGGPMLASYTEIFMPAMGNFVKNYFPVFLLGAIFGVLMTVSGYAFSIARTISEKLGTTSAIAATVITSALMTYGGISIFVVAFVMYPVARELFRVADIPRRLVPATIALGIFTFTMTALPGSPQIQNVIPGQFFGTGTYAAPVVGIIGAVLIFGLGIVWLEYRKKVLCARGEHFSSKENAPLDGVFDDPLDSGVTTLDYTANKIIPFLPLITVAAVNFLCTLVIFPNLDFSYLSEEKFGSIALKDRAALWAVIVSILCAIVLVVVLNLKNLSVMKRAIAEGARNSLLPIFSTASEVGYGAVVASVAVFAVLRDAVFNLGGNALITSVLSTSITAGLTGSSSGGMTIALNAFGPELKQMAIDQGIDLEILHRLTAMAAGGIDTLPHSGAVITLLLVCGLSHRQAYKDLGVITIAIPVLVVGLLVGAVTLVG